jgi:transposase
MADRPPEGVEALAKQVEALREENRRLHERLAELEGENERLREELDQARREAARQAAPFRRREGAKVAPEARQRPGRKPGHPASWRRPPPEVDQTVEVPLPCCPVCGEAVSDPRRIEQIIEEVPPVRPRVFRVITYSGVCGRCGTVHSTHPLQTSRAGGAAKVQLGPRALALGALLNKVLGLPMRKTCEVLRVLAGLRVSPGGLSQALDRVADRAAGLYEGLAEALRSRRAVFADETSWWVGEPGWWLWVFTSAHETVYRVADSRGSRVVEEVLGPAFGGRLVSDCLSSYDPAPYAKHKCLAHHQRAIAEARASPQTPDPAYLDTWRAFLRAVAALWTTRAELAEGDYEALRARLEARCDELLAQPCTQPGDVKVRNRLTRQRPHLLGCLYEPAAEPTNNRAERALRPAVIARKVSCGNRTDRGRRTWQVLASLGATCAQRGTDVLDLLASHIRLAPSTR